MAEVVKYFEECYSVLQKEVRHHTNNKYDDFTVYSSAVLSNQYNTFGNFSGAFVLLFGVSGIIILALSISYTVEAIAWMVWMVGIVAGIYALNKLSTTIKYKANQKVCDLYTREVTQTSQEQLDDLVSGVVELLNSYNFRVSDKDFKCGKTYLFSDIMTMTCVVSDLDDLLTKVNSLASQSGDDSN